MIDEIMSLKKLYNHSLERYCNGCNYIMEHGEEADKWINMLLSILEDMNIYLDEIEKTVDVSDDEKLNGFNV